MNISGKHIAVLVDDNFEQAEFEEPISILKDAGGEVTVIALSKKDLQGLNHIEKGDKFKSDLLLSQAVSIDYDALLVPGGAINVDNLRTSDAAQDFLAEFLNGGKPVAMICHAPWLAISANLVDGRTLTSYYTIKDDILNAGGTWVDKSVVIDDNLITSRQPDDINDFTNALIKMLRDSNTSTLSDAADTVLSSSERNNERDNRLASLGYDKYMDEINAHDEDDILSDENLQDEDELKPSSVTYDEQSDTY